MIEFDKARAEVKDMFQGYATTAREKVLQGEGVIRREFQVAIEHIRAGDYSPQNILKHCGLAVASAALSIFTPEIAIAFTVVAMMTIAAKIIKQHKPYVAALVGLSAGVIGFTLGNHFAEATFVATWSVLREFTQDVSNKVKDRLSKIAPVEEVPDAV